MENDKIKITCDDDLKFFMEESPCQKLVCDFRPESEQELSRKRTSSQLNDEANECSKKIRKQFQDIDLSSDSSSMDTDDDCYHLSSTTNTSKTSSVCDMSKVAQDDHAPDSSTVQEEPMPSTSTAGLEGLAKSPNVNIISVETIPTIQPADEAVVVPDENDNDIQIVDNEPEVANQESSEVVVANQSSDADKTKKQPGSNRIVISDSSDEDEAADDTTNNNRRHSDGPQPHFSSTYSFTNVNGNGFESRASFDGAHHHHSHRRFHRDHAARQRARFEQQARNFQRFHADNMDRIQQNVRHVTQEAARAVRASASVIPDMVSTFRQTFHPMFRVADINQQIFGTFGRR